MNRLIEIDALSGNRKIFTETISCKEKGKSVQFECNGSEFYKIKVDDSKNTYLTENDRRCDYAIVSNGGEIILFVELKGQRIEHAFNQILATKDKFSSGCSKIYGAIASGKRIPSGTNEQLYTHKKQKEEA